MRGIFAFVVFLKKHHMRITGFWMGALLLMTACRGSGQTVLTPDEFAQQIQAPGIQLLDVRTPGEFRSGHIKKALQADWTNNPEFTDRVQYLDKSRPTYVYCASGGRSAKAAAWMRQNGFAHVYELKGGFINWKANDKPVQGMPSEPPMGLPRYESLVNADRPVLVDFGAPWCPPCQKMEPVLDSLQKTLGEGFRLVKIDAGINTDLMKAKNVKGIPTFIVYKDGKERWRQEGIVSLSTLKTQLQ